MKGIYKNKRNGKTPPWLAKHLKSLGIELPKKRNKYNAVRTKVDGVNFDSKAEAENHETLKILERTGDISDLKRQVPFEFFMDEELIFTYLADHVFLTKAGDKIIADTKGGHATDTELSKIKRKIIEHAYGIKIHVWKNGVQV